MKTYFDCISCFVRQAIETVQLVTDDSRQQEDVIRAVLKEVSKIDFTRTPAEMGQKVYRIVREITGSRDPYHQIKHKFNTLVMKLYPELKKRIERTGKPLETAVRLAIAGNIIDFGVGRNVDSDVVHEAIRQAMEGVLEDEVFAEFRKCITGAKTILYLLDNAGEIVFDRLLIEQLPKEKVTAVVRGGPIINDATIADAEEIGLTGIVHVIDNGFDAPGTVLEKCSEVFLRAYAKADVIIAKGQGNYETLNQEPKKIFFIMKAKCDVVAKHLGCRVGTEIFFSIN